MLQACTNCARDADRAHTDFSGAQILPCKKEKSLDTQITVEWVKLSKSCSGFKYHREHQSSCGILMFVYLIASKLLYLLMDWETFNSFITEVPVI